MAEGIAFQIAATRDARGWTQERLADEAGIANNIPRLESPDYGKQTITSLKKLAAALDVALVVRFVPFSQYIDWLSGSPNLDEGLRPEALAVPSFEDEENKHVYEIKTDYFVLHQTITPAKIVTPQAETKPAKIHTVSGAYMAVINPQAEVA